MIHIYSKIEKRNGSNRNFRNATQADADAFFKELAALNQYASQNNISAQEYQAAHDELRRKYDAENKYGSMSLEERAKQMANTITADNTRIGASSTDSTKSDVEEKDKKGAAEEKDKTDTKDGMSTGAIIGIVIGVLAVGALIIWAATKKPSAPVVKA